MKTASRLSLAAIALIGLSLTGCMPVASPLAGGIFADVKYGIVATDAPAATKEGKACATTILGWVATGDASVQAAKTAGGISTVAVVDHSAKNILGIFAEWCTIVRGN